MHHRFQIKYYSRAIYLKNGNTIRMVKFDCIVFKLGKIFSLSICRNSKVALFLISMKDKAMTNYVYERI
jgi:hypothetical protein